MQHKNAPRPGIEPGPPGWKPGILTPRPSGTEWGTFKGEYKFILAISTPKMALQVPKVCLLY